MNCPSISGEMRGIFLNTPHFTAKQIQDKNSDFIELLAKPQLRMQLLAQSAALWSQYQFCNRIIIMQDWDPAQPSAVLPTQSCVLPEPRPILVIQVWKL